MQIVETTALVASFFKEELFLKKKAQTFALNFKKTVLFLKFNWHHPFARLECFEQDVHIFEVLSC